MKVKPNTCGTCAHAKHFERTPTGRFKQGTTSKCSAPVEWPPIPLVLKGRLPFKGGWGCTADEWAASSVSPEDGSDCPCWKAVEAIEEVVTK